MPKLARWLSVAALIGGLPSCGEPVADGTIVVMYDNQFTSAVVRVPIGARVTFLNRGRTVHNAVSSDGGWQTPDVAANSGEEGRGADVVFDRPGVYRYHCSYHGTAGGDGMAGVVVVGDVEYSPSPKGRIEPVTTPSGVTRHVPADYPTIQAAVDAAEPGDLILIEPGVYHEEVTVTTPSLVLRGIDRNAVILDGEFVRGNGMAVLADGVAVENMTARNAVLNGFFWTGVTGFRGRYLTAYNNGDYGIYAFGSTDGVIEDSYASGSPDSGFYIGQCYPCRVIVRRVVAERNGLGFSGTNAGGELYVVSSIWRHNRAGIVPSSLDVELDPPQREAVFAANLVYANHNREAPATTLTSLGFGNGILLAGAVRDTITGNVVLDHQAHGILVSPIQDRLYYAPHDNVIRDNVVLGSGRADLANGGLGATGNCFDGNEHRATAPIGLESLQGCRRLRLPWWSDLVPLASIFYRAAIAGSLDLPDFKQVTPPPPQASMTDAASLPVSLATDPYRAAAFTLASASLPPETDAVLAEFRSGPWSFDGSGLGGRLLANATLIAFLVVLGWWVARARSRRPRAHPWRGRLGALLGGALLWLVVLVVSAVVSGRI